MRSANEVRKPTKGYGLALTFHLTTYLVMFLTPFDAMKQLLERLRTANNLSLARPYFKSLA